MQTLFDIDLLADPRAEAERAALERAGVALPASGVVVSEGGEVSVWTADPADGGRLTAGPYPLTVSGPQDVASARHTAETAAVWVLARARPASPAVYYDPGVLDPARDTYSVVLYDQDRVPLGTWETSAAVGGDVARVA